MQCLLQVLFNVFLLSSSGLQSNLQRDLNISVDGKLHPNIGKILRTVTDVRFNEIRMIWIGYVDVLEQSAAGLLQLGQP